ncbi:Flp family type IVb pilin [Polaromonas sp. P2-4]|nr:Flp family type IVb pilin [Polaromonas sp. P2-4]
MLCSLYNGEGAIVRRRYQQGVTSIEYALIASLIAMAIVSGVTAAGGANAFNWSTWVGKVVTALGG